ncbi:hypothetical protein HGRIS_001315 [Hohenbuehelia grisea]|uniref:Uncharacterized protein n=1 Tax=Hohenbuehelia grisea TaxID=104357 RepID=A0ABR3JQ89_9AGAR
MMEGLASNIPRSSFLDVVLQPETNIPDIVHAGFMDETMLIHLYQLFFFTLHPFINVLDPNFHTLPYMRLRAPFLLIAVVTVSAKFHMTSVAECCCTLLQDLVRQALTNSGHQLMWYRVFSSLHSGRLPRGLEARTPNVFPP